MEQLTVLIADDERLSRRALRVHLEKRSDVRIVAECGDGRSALDAILREDPDLVFLDIRMPHLDGFELLQKLDSRTGPMVIFVTAYEEHAIRAFEVPAVDYLLKPFDERRLNSAVERAAARQRERRLGEEVEGLVRELRDTVAGRQGQHASRLLVRQSGRAFFVPTERIDWIEGAGSYVRLHVGNEVHLLRARIRDLEERLDPAMFMRIHRSTIVNLDRIAHIEAYGGSDYQVVLGNGTNLRVSRSSRDRLLRDLA